MHILTEIETETIIAVAYFEPFKQIFQTADKIAQRRHGGGFYFLLF